MNALVDLITNPFLMTGVAAWFLAQVIKTVLHAIINRKLDMTRLFGDGGMPSGHIVCHDATGVRLETQKQGYLINELVNAFTELSGDKLPEVKLKAFVGHTPIQVLAGIILGLITGFGAWLIWF